MSECYKMAKQMFWSFVRNRSFHSWLRIAITYDVAVRHCNNSINTRALSLK